MGFGKIPTLKSGSNIAVWEFRKRGERSGERVRETAIACCAMFGAFAFGSLAKKDLFAFLGDKCKT